MPYCDYAKIYPVARRITIDIEMPEIEEYIEKCVRESVGEQNPYKLKKAIFNTMLSLEFSKEKKKGWLKGEVKFILRKNGPFPLKRKLYADEMDYALGVMKGIVPGLSTLNKVTDGRFLLNELFGCPSGYIEKTVQVFFTFTVYKPKEEVVKNVGELTSLMKQESLMIPKDSHELERLRLKRSVIEDIMAHSDEAYAIYSGLPSPRGITSY